MSYRDIPIKRWICTASMAAAMALPRKLEQVCAVLNLPHQKDEEGHRLMLKMCKPQPRARDEKECERQFLEKRKKARIRAIERGGDPDKVKVTRPLPIPKWHNKKSSLLRLMKYCERDVDAELDLFLALPDLNPLERRVWELDQKINQDGFHCDRELVTTALKLVKQEQKNLEREVQKITGGQLQSARQNAKLLSWFADNGVTLPNLQAKTIVDAIDGQIADGPAMRMLELRQYSSKASTGKYDAFERSSRSDGKIRDTLLYHAASTGRWGGKNLQPQNMTKFKHLDPKAPADVKQAEIEAAIADVKTGDLEYVRALYGDPMKLLSGLIRSAIVSPPGKPFYCGDFSAIEARIAFWLAQHEAGVKAFAEGAALYEEMAAVIYDVPLKEVTAEMREVGKRVILGCGYGMGWKKFAATCKQYGTPISDELALKAVEAYRELHSPVKLAWRATENAAILAVQKPGKAFKACRCTWYMRGDFLHCQLPSKRRLSYYKPTVRWEDTFNSGSKRPVLYHWGTNSKTKQWENASTYGGRLFENIDQAAARDWVAFAMLILDEKGYETEISVHDELLTVNSKGKLEKFEGYMSIKPEWAATCPMKVSTWTGERYRK